MTAGYSISGIIIGFLGICFFTQFDKFSRVLVGLVMVYISMELLSMK